MKATLTMLAYLVPGLLLADVPPPEGDAVVAAEARLERLYTRSAPLAGGLTEGPAAAPDGSIYFSDIPFGPGGLIVRYDPAVNQLSIFSEESHKSNGLAFDAQGGLIACEGANGGGRCVSRWDTATKRRTVLADRYQGRRFNSPNDLCLDRQGRIYFTDPRYVGSEPRELETMAVYRLDPPTRRGGEYTVHEVTRDVSKPNGVALSTAGSTLYVVEHDNGGDATQMPPPQQGPMRILCFPLSSAGTVDGLRRTLIDFGDKKGCDGMTVDRDGRLYLASRDPGRPGVLVVDERGVEVAFIPTGPARQTGNQPVGLPSNVEFGVGDDAHSLYVTVDLSLYRIRLKARR